MQIWRDSVLASGELWLRLKFIADNKQSKLKSTCGPGLLVADEVAHITLIEFFPDDRRAAEDLKRFLIGEAVDPARLDVLKAKLHVYRDWAKLLPWLVDVLVDADPDTIYLLRDHVVEEGESFLSDLTISLKSKPESLSVALDSVLHPVGAQWGRKLHTLSSGWTVWLLDTQDAIKREGRAMENCLKDPKVNRFVNGQHHYSNDQVSVFSVRDPDGAPMLNFGVSHTAISKDPVAVKFEDVELWDNDPLLSHYREAYQWVRQQPEYRQLGLTMGFWSGRLIDVRDVGPGLKLYSIGHVDSDPTYDRLVMLNNPDQELPQNVQKPNFGNISFTPGRRPLRGNGFLLCRNDSPQILISAAHPDGTIACSVLSTVPGRDVDPALLQRVFDSPEAAGLFWSSWSAVCVKVPLQDVTISADEIGFHGKYVDACSISADGAYFRGCHVSNSSVLSLSVGVYHAVQFTKTKFSKHMMLTIFESVTFENCDLKGLMLEAAAPHASMTCDATSFSTLSPDYQQHFTEPKPGQHVWTDIHASGEV